MGNRVKGRVKRKSIRAKITSTAGSKRKLSRMGKKQQKGHAGLEASYIGRSKCLKILQVHLKDFRRLCILKGIYPREAPSGRVPGKKKGQTFYHVKDIRAVAHEPVLDKFREFRAFMKKVRRAAGRNERDEAVRKNQLVPQYTLHHLVRERYPRFVDALGDLDDCLTLTYLFAALPGGGTGGVTGSSGEKKSRDHQKDVLRPGTVRAAQSFVAAWGAYLAATNAVTKSFVSVKGVYMEAVVRSTEIRWIIPHAFTQFVPDDVDCRVMVQFFEFYQTLLQFVLFKLYNDDLGLRYPLVSVNRQEGNTSAVLSQHLRALTAALESKKSGGAISSVVRESVEKENKTKDENKSGSDNVTLSSRSTGSKTTSAAVQSEKINEKDRKRIESVGAALHQLKEQGGGKDDGEVEDEEEEGASADKKNDNDDDDDGSVDVAGPLQAALEESLAREDGDDGGAETTTTTDDTARVRKRLFQGFVFYFSREVPRGYLELVCLSFGAKAVGWETNGGDGGDVDGSIGPMFVRSDKDPSITHYVMDRPAIPGAAAASSSSSRGNKYHYPNREFVQPQWILDCANFLFLLPTARYAVGAKSLPPHLSPWVDDREEGYTPAYAQEVQRLKDGLPPVEAVQRDADADAQDEDAEESESEDNNMEQDENEKEKDEEADDGSDDDDDGNDDDENDTEGEEEDPETLKKLRQRRETKRREKEERESHEMAKTMMNRKAQHLYARMQHGIRRKQTAVDELHKKRKELEKRGKKRQQGGGTTAAAQHRDDDSSSPAKTDNRNNSKTILKQKVERLKEERKSIERVYAETGGSMKKNNKKNKKNKEEDDNEKKKKNKKRRTI